MSIDIFNSSVEYCATAYRKKQEFAGSILNIDNFNCDSPNQSSSRKGQYLMLETRKEYNLYNFNSELKI